MTSQTDKLFKDKLENLQHPVSAAAWDRIESNLDKKNDKALWLKIAAAITLLAVATYVFWPTQVSVKKNDLAKTKKEKNPAPLPKVEITEPITQATIGEQKSIHQTATQTKKANRKVEEPAVATKVESNEPVQLNTTNATIESSTTVASLEPAQTTEVTPSKTIIYTADEVNAKYLRKKSPTEATVAEKKSSGMQKLIGVAYAIKNPDSGLSDLRQKKDEILALNFLNEDKNNKGKN